MPKAVPMCCARRRPASLTAKLSSECICLSRIHFTLVFLHVSSLHIYVCYLPSVYTLLFLLYMTIISKYIWGRKNMKTEERVCLYKKHNYLVAYRLQIFNRSILGHDSREAVQQKKCSRKNLFSRVLSTSCSHAS